ncbi:MAG: SO_0444 family Cu/Zn efflux transporter [Muribaculaceae bacterium]
MEFFNSLLAMLNGMSPYLLLGFLIAGVLHSFVPEWVYSRHLAGNDVKSIVKAALLGIPLPLCSCGVLPTAVSLRNSGASRASSTSFLIATPQTGVDSIAATYSLLGPAFAVIRPVAALVTAMLGGCLAAAVEGKVESTAVGDGCNGDCGDGCGDCKAATTAGKCLEALKYGFFDMMKSIGKWLAIGLVVAALINVLVPDDFFARYAQYPMLNMLVVLAVSVPMYVCATGSIPIALSLMMKGLTPGAALVLLMAGPAANFASVLVIRRSFGLNATRAYLASIIGGAVAFGMIVDYVLPGEWFVPQMAPAMIHSSGGMNVFHTICSVALVAMLVVAQASKVMKSMKIKNTVTTMTKEFKIKGMMCAHCQANVEKNLSALPGVTKVSVDLAKGIAYVEGEVDSDVVIAKITEIGYEYVG